MPLLLRRFELLLPLRYNDGRRIPGELLAQTRREIEERFGAISSETQPIHGFDRNTSDSEDKLLRVFADVPDTAENRAFFTGYKEELKRRFEQREISITTYPVEAL